MNPKPIHAIRSYCRKVVINYFVDGNLMNSWLIRIKTCLLINVRLTVFLILQQR